VVPVNPSTSGVPQVSEVCKDPRVRSVTPVFQAEAASQVRMAHKVSEVLPVLTVSAVSLVPEVDAVLEAQTVSKVSKVLTVRMVSQALLVFQELMLATTVLSLLDTVKRGPFLTAQSIPTGFGRATVSCTLKETPSLTTKTLVVPVLA
jgi:hypothetical protein